MYYTIIVIIWLLVWRINHITKQNDIPWNNITYWYGIRPGMHYTWREYLLAAKIKYSMSKIGFARHFKVNKRIKRRNAKYKKTWRITIKKLIVQYIQIMPLPIIILRSLQQFHRTQRGTILEISRHCQVFEGVVAWGRLPRHYNYITLATGIVVTSRANTWLLSHRSLAKPVSRDTCFKLRLAAKLWRSRWSRA